MNKKILQSVLWGFILILSSCRSSQPPYDGTYEGILPAADCPGIYVLLTINGGQYELLEKYITRPGMERPEIYPVIRFFWIIRWNSNPMMAACYIRIRP